MTAPPIPYARQDVRPDDIEAVAAALRSDWLTQGPGAGLFEDAIKTHCGCRHAVAVNSGTSALHLACAALDLGPGDWLWTSPNTFVASANCALYCGASVDFVDIDSGTYNMSLGALEAKLREAAKANRLPKILVPVHFAGQSCDMRAIRGLADRYGFRIVEDASHAVGGSYLGEPIGTCRYSDITVFSFHAVKIVTTAEGGAAVTNDATLANRIARLRTHGITRAQSEFEGKADGPWDYQMLELGWNYRLTDLQAALGCSQMKRLGEYVERRSTLADRYDRLLAGSGIGLPQRNFDCKSAWHLYVVRWNEKATGIARGEAFGRLRAAGIGVNVHYIPVHLQPYYRRLGFQRGQFPNSEAHYDQCITLPLYAGFTFDQQDEVVKWLLSMRR